MYAVDEQDAVLSLAEIPLPDIGAPMPRISANEHEASVTYFIRGDSDKEATVTFSGLRVITSGPPNDEAFEGHPLSARGLAAYGAYEVERSSWIRSLERMNRVHPFHRPEAFDALRHFVISFHDTTLECIAENVTCAAEAEQASGALGIHHP